MVGFSSLDNTEIERSVSSGWIYPVLYRRDNTKTIFWDDCIGEDTFGPMDCKKSLVSYMNLQYADIADSPLVANVSVIFLARDSFAVIKSVSNSCVVCIICVELVSKL